MARQFRWIVILALAIGHASSVSAANGALLDREPLVPVLDYETWFAKAFASSDDALDPKPDLVRARAYYTASLYQALRDRDRVAADRITYSSDGLRIAGVIVRALDHSSKSPVIIWCRGGIGQTGGITLGDVMIMTNWARAGYIVIASNYRGGPRSEGHDEDGGSDVDDVAALGTLASSLPEADGRTLFLYGQSRGGMMVYELLARGFPARAAVVNSGVSDLSRMDRPDARSMRDLMREAMPDYAEEVRHHFCRRSAICWPEKLKAPVLLLHGTADRRVPADQAIALARRLQRLGSSYAMHLYGGGAHVWLNQDQSAVDEEILRFFEDHAR